MTQDLLEAVHSRVARIATSGSTVRGRGHAGAAEAARKFCRRLDLQEFGSSESTFRAELDSETEALKRFFPPNAQKWGLARKVLNIFLRDCFYTTYLNEAFRLDRLERFLELPLDSITGTELRRVAGPKVLPAWPGVIHVTPPINAAYQATASVEAAKKGVARVHLDAMWWSVGRD